MPRWRGGATISIEERRRIRLFERWVETWGREEAATMLELFPPPGRSVATDEDAAALDAKIDVTRRELELKIDAAISQLTAVFRAEIHQAIVTQTRITVFSMVTAFAAVSALVLGID